MRSKKLLVRCDPLRQFNPRTGLSAKQFCIVLPTSIEGLTRSLAIAHQFKCETYVQIDICQRVEPLVSGKDRPCHFEVLDGFCVPGIEGRGPLKEAIVAVELTPFPAYRAGAEEEPIRSICFRDAELVTVLLIDLKRFSNEPLGR